MEDGLVNEEPVRALAVLAEALAVIADHGHDGPVEELPRFEKREEAADLRVGERHFARYGFAAKRVRYGSGGSYGECAS